MSDLDDFTAQLNNADSDEKVTVGGAAAEDEEAQLAEALKKMTPEQRAQFEKAQEMQKKIDARPLDEDALKGKVDIKWYGHAGFKLGFKDQDGVQRAIYVDVWIDNKDCPEEEKKDCPNDCDLALVTHGQLDHSMHAPFLIMAGKKDKRQIVCTSEVGTYYELFRKIPQPFLKKMQKGGTVDFGFCKVTMVHADHPSTCVGPQGVQITGGDACGFVISIPHHDLRVYHAGDTNIFSDMKLIDELYQPNVAMLPIGDCIGMGPREAAYCAKHFLPGVHTFIPMHFNSFPVLTGTPEMFEEECKKLDLGKKIIHPKKFHGGAAIVE